MITPRLDDCEGKKGDEKGEVPLPERMLKSRTILLSKPVDDKMVESVTSQLTLMEADNSDPITVYVNSPGGSADCGFAIYDLFRFVDSPIITLCSGICASAAILIFLGGEKGKRYSLEHSRFLLHQPSTAAQGTASDLQITATQIINLRQRYNEIVGREIDRDPAIITEDSARDFWLSASEAQDYGLVDQVIIKKEEMKK